MLNKSRKKFKNVIRSFLRVESRSTVGEQQKIDKPFRLRRWVVSRCSCLVAGNPILSRTKCLDWYQSINLLDELISHVSSLSVGSRPFSRTSHRKMFSFFRERCQVWWPFDFTSTRLTSCSSAWWHKEENYQRCSPRFCFNFPSKGNLIFSDRLDRPSRYWFQFHAEHVFMLSTLMFWLLLFLSTVSCSLSHCLHVTAAFTWRRRFWKGGKRGLHHCERLHHLEFHQFPFWHFFHAWLAGGDLKLSVAWCSRWLKASTDRWVGCLNCSPCITQKLCLQSAKNIIKS